MSLEKKVRENPIINPYKPTRTPIQTFFKLLASGKFSEIARILLRKLLTSIAILTSFVKKLLGATVARIPFVKAYLGKRHLREILKRFYNTPSRQTKENTLKIALVLRSGTTHPGSSAFIRLISPLTDPSVSEKLTIKLYPQNTTQVEGADICIIQRTAFDDIKKAKELVKNTSLTKTALIVDSDDGFNEIDQSHPEYLLHRGRMDAFNYLLEEADRVWFSTTELAKSHPEIKNKIKVIPNSLDERVWKKSIRSQSIRSGPIQLIYMGTATHNNDFEFILPALDSIAKRHPGKFRLSVIGISDNLPEREWIRRLSPSKGSIYPRFVEWLMSNNDFDVGLSPLVNSPFNRYKSDIKCLDYLAAGIVPLVSDTPPYRSKSLDKFIFRVDNTHEAWIQALSEIVSNPMVTLRKVRRMVSLGQDYLWSERSSEITAQNLLSELESLTDRS